MLIACAARVNQHTHRPVLSVHFRHVRIFSFLHKRVVGCRNKPTVFFYCDTKFDACPKFLFVCVYVCREHQHPPIHSNSKIPAAPVARFQSGAAITATGKVLTHRSKQLKHHQTHKNECISCLLTPRSSTTKAKHDPRIRSQTEFRWQRLFRLSVPLLTLSQK